MKLYTEKQVKEIVLKSRETGLTADYLMLTITPIELPSDVEIEKEKEKLKFKSSHDIDFSYYISESFGFKMGALWMKEQILNQNK